MVGLIFMRNTRGLGFETRRSHKRDDRRPSGLEPPGMAACARPGASHGFQSLASNTGSGPELG
jgi:hypothetical protein